MTAENTQAAINSKCPWSGNPVASDSLSTYRGHTIGFCNPGCRDKFDVAKDCFDQAIEEAESIRRTPTVANGCFLRLADYNAWINRELYAACGKLSADQLREDRGAFFKSIIGTLNHIVVWDVTWLKRFYLARSDFQCLAILEEWPTPTSHDYVFHDDLSALGKVRSELDELLIDFIQSTDTDDYRSPISYRISSGEVFHKNFGGMLQHLFNHQTHHRGQLSTLLFQAGVDPGVTDLLARLPEENVL